jgi:hypothetical protein
MSLRHILLAAAILTPSMGFASVVVSEDAGDTQTSSLTGIAQMNGTPLEREPFVSIPVTQAGSSVSVVLISPSQDVSIDAIQVAADLQVINLPPVPLPDPSAIRYGGGSLLYLANDYDFPSEFSSAPRVIAAPVIEVAPGALQVVLEPSSVPENGTGSLWALGGVALLLMSRRTAA